MPNTNLIIAIDGFSSCGKSTLAKALAGALAKTHHFLYIDSGAMYRACTLFLIRSGIDLLNHDEVSAIVGEQMHISFERHDNRIMVLLNEEDVSDEIRGMRVSENVSHVSTIKAVRTRLVALQQKLGKTKNIIMDGRDIGTTVFPEAILKIFMNAEERVRIQRRFDELTAKGIHIPFAEIEKNIRERDYEDTHRKESPLRKAPDAILLDNTRLSETEQLDFVIKKFTEAVPLDF